MIGIITSVFEVSELAHPFFGRVFIGARRRLIAGGYDLLLCSNRAELPSDALRAAAVERTIGHGVDALIAWGMGLNDPEVAPIINSRLPSVFIDLNPIGERTAYVTSDNIKAMTEVIEHLYKNGRRRIAHIAGHPNACPGVDRLLGYRSGLSQQDLAYRPEFVEQGDYYQVSAYEATKRLLGLPDPPDAITCASDSMAIGAMTAIEEAGLRIPGDVAVTGFDDAELATRVHPSLTTVRQDTFGLGTAAAEAVLRMLANPNESPPVAILPTKFVVRESSLPAKGK